MEGFATKYRGSLYGYTGGQAEMMYTPNGKAVTKVSVAVGGGEGRKPRWIQMIFWEKAAEVANQVLDKKGMAVIVEGRPDASAYKSRKGELKSQMILTVDRLWIVEEGDKQVEVDLEGK